AGNNYLVVLNTATGTTTPATLTLDAVTDNKRYDGTTDSSVNPTVTGLMDGDSLSDLSQSFDSKNVLGTDGSTLSVNTDYVLDDGNDGKNYQVVLNTATGTIAPATLTLVASSDSKLYDGTTDSDGRVRVSGLVSGDSLEQLSQFFDSAETGERLLLVD